MATEISEKKNPPDFLPLPRIFLIVIGIFIIIMALYLLMIYDKISSSVQDATMAAVFFVALPTIYISLIYRSLRKQAGFVKEIAPRLEMLGIHFTAAQSRLALVLNGFLDDIKIQFSPFSLGKNKFEFYILTLFHQNPVNSKILCTNTGYLVGNNPLSISFRNHFGLKKTAIPGIYDNEIKCWIKDDAMGQEIFHDDKLKYSILKLDEILKHQSACFVLDDQCLRIAFPVDILPETTSLDAAKDLCQAIGDISNMNIVQPEKTSEPVLTPTKVHQYR